MAKLKEYSKSKVNAISITYNGENIKFNLFDEVQISMVSLDRELKNQPSYYGFLLLLHKKLSTRVEELKLERKKLWGELYLEAKTSTTQNGRPFTDDMSKAWVECHKEYVLASRKCIRARDEADLLFACVKAFEQRKDLMQTLSSNQRKERL